MGKTSIGRVQCEQCGFTVQSRVEAQHGEKLSEVRRWVRAELITRITIAQMRFKKLVDEGKVALQK